MKTAGIPQSTASPLREFLDRYLRGLGRERLLRDGESASRFSARGGIKEAALQLGDIEPYLRARSHDFDQFFRRLRVFLFDGDSPIGTVSLELTDQTWVPESVTLGAIDELIAALSRAEQFPGSAAHEVRILRVARLCSEALVLTDDSVPVAYYSIIPLYRRQSGQLGPEQYGDFLRSLLDRHLQVFPLAPR